MENNKHNDVECRKRLGERLKECRLELGYTQAELADKICELPENNGKERAANQIGYLERGIRSISYEYAALLSQVLGVRAEYLLGDDNYKTQLDYEYARCEKESDEFTRDLGKEYVHQSIAREIIRESGYKFYKRTGAEDELTLKQEEFNECHEFVKKNIDIFKYFWELEEIENTVKRKAAELYPGSKKPLIRFRQVKTEIGLEHKIAIVDNHENQMNFLRDIVNHRIKFDEECRKSAEMNYVMVDNNSKPIVTCTFADYEFFLREIFNITDLLIRGFIDRQKYKEQECKNKED